MLKAELNDTVAGSYGVRGRKLASEQLNALWTHATVERCLGGTEPVTVWISGRCRTGLADRVAESLADVLRQRQTDVHWYDARQRDFRQALDVGVAVNSPVFPSGIPVPRVWLEATRLVVIGEAKRHRIWGFEGAMAAQAEPLQTIFPVPWFRRRHLLCEVQRLGGADLSVVLISSPSEEVCLVVSSALTADVLLAREARLETTQVPHLATWSQHFVLQQDLPEAGWIWPAVGERPRATVRVLGQIVADGLTWLATICADLRAARSNLHRIRPFLRNRAGKHRQVG